MLAGYVTDAHEGKPLKGVAVRAKWLELALESRNYHAVTRTVTALTDDDGRYLVCGMTSDDAVHLEVLGTGYFPIASHLLVPRDGATRQDFLLATSGLSRGPNAINGHVRLGGTEPLESGFAAISALGLEVPITRGDFAFTSLPAGTWVVDTRAIGLEPQSTYVAVQEGSTATPTIAMDPHAQLLSAVSVRGRPGGQAKILNAIEQRRRTSNGTVFMPGNDWLNVARDPTDLMRDATGFRYLNPDQLAASGCSFKPSNGEAFTVVTATPQQRERSLAVYLDGLRVIGGLPELRTAVTMHEILAVEAYQDIMTAPIEWRTYDACAVIAVWTSAPGLRHVRDLPTGVFLCQQSH